MIRIVAAELFRAELRTRMPFRYGIATMTELPHVFLRVVIEVGATRATGIAADGLPPKWFTKDPSRDPRDEIDEMLRVIRQAMAHAAELRGPSVFAVWRDLYTAQAAWAETEKIPPLLAHFGTSLVERALIDAWARHAGAPFHALLRENTLGLELGWFHPELASTTPAQWLPEQPLASVFARHTIGLADPLTEADIALGERIDDGLPQTLEQCVQRYGLRHFKIKVAGSGASDLARLERIAALLAQQAPADFACSLDGNESFHDVDAFLEFTRELRARTALAPILSRVLFIEQPFHRDIALSPALASFARRADELPPVIIDESDAELGSLRAALALGYAGTSHKNCKGVFKGVANACRLAQIRREGGGRSLMSGEDLACVGPVSMLQDLAVQAALGNASVERNGHHYFRGISFWPREVQAQALERHPDLYVRSKAGWPRIDVRDGRIATHTINAAPFGVGFLPEVAAFAMRVA